MFSEENFLIGLNAGLLHIHTGPENPFVEPPRKTIWQEREKQVMEYFRNIFANTE